MNIFDFDLDRFAKALNIKGFDLVLLLDHSGTVLAEKSDLDLDSGTIAKLITSIIQLAHSLGETFEAGKVRTAGIEFEKRMLALGRSETFLLCGIPAAGTPHAFAKNEIEHALKSLL